MVELGIDQHKKFSQVAVLDTTTGTVRELRLEHDAPDRFRELVTSLGPEVRASLETTGNWYWLADLLEDAGTKVQLANTVETRRLLKARAKNDRLDALALATLSADGLLPTVYVPEREARDARERHRFRIELIRLQTRLKNIVHSILSKVNVKVPFDDIFGKSGRECLEALELRAPYEAHLRAALRILDAIAPEVKRVEKAIEKTVSPGSVPRLLWTVPGLGVLRSYVIFYETGPVKRFNHHGQYVHYCSLAPGTWETADRHRGLPVGRRGNLYLKETFCCAAQTAVRSDPALAVYYKKIRDRKGSGTATIAVARKLAIAVYHMLRKNQAYRPAAKTTHKGKPHWCLGRCSKTLTKIGKPASE